MGYDKKTKAQLIEEIDFLKKQLAAVTAERDAKVNAGAEAAEKEIKKLKCEADKKGKTIAELQATIAKKDDALTAFASEHAKNEEYIHYLDVCKAENIKEIEGLKQQIARLKATIAEKDAAIEELRAKLKALQSGKPQQQTAKSQQGSGDGAKTGAPSGGSGIKHPGIQQLFTDGKKASAGQDDDPALEEAVKKFMARVNKKND